MVYIIKNLTATYFIGLVTKGKLGGDEKHKIFIGEGQS